VAREIAIDLDGVVFDFVSAFCAVCRQEGYSLKYEQITEYHMGKVLGVDDEELYRLLDLTYTRVLYGPILELHRGFERFARTVGRFGS
jgi:uncharacterized HAD superfamily protein